MGSRISGLLGGGTEIDHYELKVRKPGGTGWAVPSNAFPAFETELKNTDDLDEPLDQDVVENTAESEDWPAGTYAMEAKGTDGSVVGYEWNDLVVEVDEDDAVEEELTPGEAALQEIRAMRAELDGPARITSPDEAYGQLFEMFSDVAADDPQAIGQLRQFLKEWQATTQEPPTSPGEFAGRVAQQRFEAGDTEGAVSLLDGWFAAESTGESGGLLADALSGDVELDGSVGLLELAGLDAYTRMEPALDRIATSVGDQAADAVEGGEVDNLLSNALAEGSQRDRGADAVDDDRDDVVDEADRDVDVDDAAGGADAGLSSTDVAQLSEGFDGPRRDVDEAAPATASAGPSESAITPDEAAAVADDVAPAFGGEA